MTTKQERVDQLRQRAESQLARSLAPEEILLDARGLLHELHVHQVELEFQNDELRETQLQLQESRDRYQALFDEAPVGYLILDPEGRILEANRAAIRLLGVERKVFVDRRLQMFAQDPQDVQKLNEHLAGIFAAVPVPPKEVELSFRRGDADTIHVRLESQSVRAAASQSGRCFSVLIDVTARSRAEDALAERSQRLMDSLQAAQLLERQLVEAKRLEAIGRLAGGVAHDFNNMLTVTNGAAQVALDRLPPNHPMRRYLEQILLAGERSAKLTSQLLAIGRRQFLSPECIDLATLVQETCTLLDATLGPNVRVSFTPPDGSVFAEADPTGLRQGLVNLAINARDAMPDGGNLKLSVERVELDEDGARLHPGASRGPYAVLAVSDDGVGLDPESRERIFEPFFSTKPSGTGLGLASVHGYVSQTGGFVSVESGPSRGTTFQIYLPAVDEPPEQPAGGSPLELAAGPGSGVVLLVEDEDLLRDLLTEVLSRAGFEVVSAGSGQEALRLCRERDQPVELALLDVLMPGMNGVEVAEALRGIVPKCQFIFMSGFAGEDLVRRIGQEIHGLLLQKPLSPGQLVQEVQRALAR